MKKMMKYILLLLIAAIGTYNLIGWFGQSSAMPLYFAAECYCLCGILALIRRKPYAGKHNVLISILYG